MQFEAHKEAKTWLDDRLNGSDGVGLPWGALLAFLRLSASPRVLSRPIALREATAVVGAWLELPVTWTPQPTERHAQTLARLLGRESKVDLVSDAHLAAIAIEHGLTLCSTDRDFARFEGLRWTDPLNAPT
ncbi:MAG: PIN domain-containing protein [Actinomycetota bacterium]|nr:PIN domain-containing protein [Actinomycetota bacterium]